MIAVFCGSREWTDAAAVRRVMEGLVAADGLTVIHGDQRGADLVSDSVAKELGVPVVPVPAEWEAYGRAAGPERNERMKQMLLRCGRDWGQRVACYAFHMDPRLGVGTRDMVRRCRLAGIRSYAYLGTSGECVRASGDVVCDDCGMPYRKHPSVISETDRDGNPFLELACDGRLLKL